MTGPGCGWSKISRVRAPYDNLGPAVKPLQSPESAVYIMDSLLGGYFLLQESRAESMAWPYSTNCHAILPDIFEKLRNASRLPSALGWPTAPPLHGSSRMTPQPLLERPITRYPRYCNFMGYFTHKSQPVKSLRTVSPRSAGGHDSRVLVAHGAIMAVAAVLAPARFLPRAAGGRIPPRRNPSCSRSEPWPCSASTWSSAGPSMWTRIGKPT